MIAIDTNVLVRFLVRDNLEQAESARALLDTLTPEEPGFICREVLLEVVWVLERSYRLSRAQIANVLQGLLTSDDFVIESSTSVSTILDTYRNGRDGFSDLMILAATGNAGANPLYTFDRKFARLDEVVLLDAEPRDISQSVESPQSEPSSSLSEAIQSEPPRTSEITSESEFLASLPSQQELSRVAEPAPADRTAEEDSAGWIPLSERRSYTGTNPAEIMFPDGSVNFTNNSWAQVIAEITGWLYAEGHLSISNMPIELPRATTRYLVSDGHVHPSGSDFLQPKKAGPLYVETNYNASTLVAHTRYIITHVGQDPSEFKVRLPSQ